MSQPDSGEYSVRSLAEILREHGLESELGTRPGRRRKAGDPETGRSARVETGSRARPDAPARAPGAPAQPARSATPPRTPAPARSQAPVWAPAPEPTYRPAAGLAGPDAPVRTPPRAPAAAPAPVPPRAPADPGPMSTTGPVGGRSDVAKPPARRRSDAEVAAERASEERGGLYGQGPSTSAIPAKGSPTTGSSQHSRAAEAAARARRAAEHPVTGPIPVVTAQAAAEAAAADAEPLTGKESALAWARFAGELVVALAVGIGVYFLFTVLWELMPYVALVAAPLTVTGLVAGVAAWRQRRGQGQLGVRLLAVLLLAGTVLVIAPAAGLLAST